LPERWRPSPVQSSFVQVANAAVPVRPDAVAARRCRGVAAADCYRRRRWQTCAVSSMACPL